MARYVTPDVENIRDSPEPGEFIALAVVIADDAKAGVVKSRVRDLGGELIRELPSGVLVVHLPQTDLTEFCEWDLLESVSRPDRMQVQT